MKRNNKRNSRRGKNQPVLKRLWARTHKLSAHTTEEEEWQTDMPNIKLSRAFVIVLILHIVAVGGILAFELFKKEPKVAEKPASGSYKPASNVPPAVEPPAPSSVAHTGIVHRVQSGEGILEVAQRYNVSVAALERANKLDSSANGLFAGQRLDIPNRQIRPNLPSEIAEINRARQNQVLPANNRLPGGAQVPVNHQPAPAPAPAPAPQPVQEVVQHTPPAPAPQRVEQKPIVRQERKPVVHYQPRPIKPKAKPAPVQQPASSGRVHTVQKGENPYRIAKSYGVNMKTLLRHNGISDPTNLKIGTRLRIP